MRKMSLQAGSKGAAMKKTKTAGDLSAKKRPIDRNREQKLPGKPRAVDLAHTFVGKELDEKNTAVEDDGKENKPAEIQSNEIDAKRAESAESLVRTVSCFHQIFTLMPPDKTLSITSRGTQPSVARVLDGLSIDTVYPILLLCPPVTPVPFMSCRNLLLGSLLVLWHTDSCWIQHVKVYSIKFLLVGFVLIETR